jgi:hypothetical protein
VKWFVLVVLLVPVLAFAQTPSTQFDLTKKSGFQGKTFDTKTFTTKTYPTQTYATKTAETKEFDTKNSPMGQEQYAAKNFTPPAEKKVSWWQKLFGTHSSGMGDKTVPGKNYATTNFPGKNTPTRVNEPLQEKYDHMMSPTALAMPNIKPTPKELNKPVDSHPKGFPTATPTSP